MTARRIRVVLALAAACAASRPAPGVAAPTARAATETFARSFDLSSNGRMGQGPDATFVPANQAPPGSVMFVAWAEAGERIAYCSSLDGGQTFCRPRLLSAAGRQCAVTQTPNDVLVASTGHDSLAVTRSNDSGLSMLPYPRLVQRDTSLANPALAYCSDMVGLAWDFNSTRIRFARSLDHGATFGGPIQVSLTELAGYFQQRPAVAVDSLDTVYVAWNHSRNFASPQRWILFSRSFTHGASFSVPAAISDTARSAYDVHIAAGLSPGVVDAMWIYSGAVDSVIYRQSTSGGALFRPRAAVAIPGDGGGTAHHVWFVRSPNGRLCCTVQAQVGGHPECLYFELANGAFSVPTDFSNTAGLDSLSPVVILDGSATPYLFWSDVIGGARDIAVTHTVP